MRFLAGIIVGTVVTSIGWLICVEAVIEFVKKVQEMI